MKTLPWSGTSRPATRRSVVVLPAPLGPSRTMNSPLAISSERSATALTAPKRLPTPARRSSATERLAAKRERAPARLVEQRHRGGIEHQADMLAALGLGLGPDLGAQGRADRG